METSSEEISRETAHSNLEEQRKPVQKVYKEPQEIPRDEYRIYRPPEPVLRTEQRPIPREPTPEEKQRERISELVGELLTIATELGYDLGEIDLEKCFKCPLLKHTQEILKVLNRLRKEMLKQAPRRPRSPA